MCQKLTVFIEMLFKEFDCETLVDSCSAGVTLIPTPVGGPLVLVGLPWKLALADESLFVLFGVVPCPSDRFVMDVMLGILKDLLQPSCRLLVNLHMVLVKRGLPVFCLFALELALSYAAKAASRCLRLK